MRFTILLFLLFSTISPAETAWKPQWTVSLYKGTTKVTPDAPFDTQLAAWEACLTKAQALQATTTAKVTCKTPVLGLLAYTLPPAPPPAPIPSPGPTTGSVKLTWSLVTENVNGSVYTDPFGYVIEYGTALSALTQHIDVNNPAATVYVVTGLPLGATYYFCVRTRNTSNVRSECSSAVSRTL
jgi:hypothetical protein